MDAAALIVAILALLVSLGALWYSREQTQIDQARRGEEVADRKKADHAEKAADVTIRLSMPEANAARLLILANSGPASASDIAVSVAALDDRPLPARLNVELSDLADHLGRGQESHIRLRTSLQTSTLMSFHVEWSDLTGRHEKGFNLSV